MVFDTKDGGQQANVEIFKMFLRLLVDLLFTFCLAMLIAPSSWQSCIDDTLYV